MSHGEAFDLPMHEAAACGLQLIAPAHSAYLDYLHREIAHLLPVEEVPVVWPYDPETAALFEGAHWWEPDAGAAEQLLRGLMEGTIGEPQSARHFLTQRYHWRDAGWRLFDLLSRLPPP